MLVTFQHAQLWLYRIEKETHSNYHSSRCRKWFTRNINLNSSFSTFGWLRNTSKKMPNNKFIYSLKENKQNKMQRLQLQKEYYIYNNIYTRIWQKLTNLWQHMSLHGGPDSMKIPQLRTLLDEWVDGLCHHVLHYQGFSKALLLGPTTFGHTNPIVGVVVVLPQFSVQKYYVK